MRLVLRICADVLIFTAISSLECISMLAFFIRRAIFSVTCFSCRPCSIVSSPASSPVLPSLFSLLPQLKQAPSALCAG